MKFNYKHTIFYFVIASLIGVGIIFYFNREKEEEIQLDEQTLQEVKEFNISMDSVRIKNNMKVYPTVQTIVQSSVEVKYLSTRDIKHYGNLVLCRPYNISQTIIKNRDYTMQIYKDSIGTKSIDTLILYRNGKITYKTVEGEKIDEKVVEIKNKNVLIQKIYFPHISPESVDNFSGQIVYLSQDGFIARYGIIGNHLKVFNPQLYADFHKAVLYKKTNFKRHKEENNDFGP